MLKTLNASNQRKLPVDVPTDFIPKRLLPFVMKDDQADRSAWECALLFKVQTAPTNHYARLDEDG